MIQKGENKSAVSKLAPYARTLGEAVLVTLATTGMLATIAIAPNAVQLFGYIPLYRDFDKPRRKYQMSKILSRLAQKGLVKRGPRGYALTPLGKDFLNVFAIRGLSAPKRRRWDGKWRILLFDIPENLRFRRDTLRQYLERLGFVLLHKSVWLFPYPCEEVVELLRRHLELGRSRVYALTADSFDGDEHFREKFGIRS